MGLSGHGTHSDGAQRSQRGDCRCRRHGLRGGHSRHGTVRPAHGPGQLFHGPPGHSQGAGRNAVRSRPDWPGHQGLSCSGHIRSGDVSAADFCRLFLRQLRLSGLGLAVQLMTRRLAQARSLPAAPAAARTRPGILSTAMTLAKIRIGIAIMLSSLSGAVLAAGGWPAAGETLILGLAVLIAASGAGAFNHWYDRDIDAVMGRTRRRPFVNGALKPHAGWPLLFIVMMVAGSLLAGLR